LPSSYSYGISSGQLASYFQAIGAVTDLGVPENTFSPLGALRRSRLHHALAHL
jgi:hypothetical protein